MSVVVRVVCVGALLCAMAGHVHAGSADGASRDMSAQRRPSITIYPNPSYPGPNATRHCDSWLAKEYRVSGTVVVPKMRCYWR